MYFQILRHLKTDIRGATAIEYGLIAALISVAAIAAFTALGGSLTTLFTGVSTALTNATPTGS